MNWTVTSSSLTRYIPSGQNTSGKLLKQHWKCIVFVTCFNVTISTYFQRLTSTLFQCHNPILFPRQTLTLFQSHISSLTQHQASMLFQCHIYTLSQRHAAALLQHHIYTLFQRQTAILFQRHVSTLSQRHSATLFQRHVFMFSQRLTATLFQRHISTLSQRQIAILFFNKKKNLSLHLPALNWLLSAGSSNLYKYILILFTNIASLRGFELLTIFFNRSEVVRPTPLRHQRTCFTLKNVYCNILLFARY